MKKRGSLKGLFNRFAAATLLSAGILSGTVAAQSVEATPQPPSPAVAASCPAYPDFHRPDGPMHRIPRDRTVDLVLRDNQLLLKQIGIHTSAADGLGGAGTRASIREFLMFYAPVYSGDANKFTMNAEDSTQLKKYADAAAADAKLYKISTAQAAALGLASARTGVTVATLAKNTGHKFTNPEWLYMVKTYGASYGMEFYAGHIAADADGKLTVDNPFVYRQILDLKDHQRLSALMSAEYLLHKNAMPVFAKAPHLVADPALRPQQRDLIALGFDVGTSADGVKGDKTGISIAEFQLLYGEGTTTGTLTAGEIKTLTAAAARARTDGTAFNAPTLASGPVRMASDRSGADFGYMMKLAEAESSFQHAAKASTSSATGLYQFIEGTWSYMILNYGAKHGLGDFAPQVETYKDELGRDQARIANPLVRQALLDLRANPQVAALFSADFQGENKGREACYVEGTLTRADLYLAHFLGPSDAVWFITQMQANPNQSAPETFPEEASYNETVFYETKHGVIVRDRTLKEVYDNFARKFDETPAQSQLGAAVPPAPKAPAPPG